MNIEPYKKRKKELKLTNEDVAKIAGISKRTVEDFFRGYTDNPRIDTVQAIEKALGLSSDPEEKTLSENAERLLTAYSSLIPSMQEYVLQMVLALVAQPQNRK